MSSSQARRFAQAIGKFFTAIVAGVATGVLVLSLSMIARDAMAAVPKADVDYPVSGARLLTTNQISRGAQ